MALPQVDDTDYLIQWIDDTIRDLQLRKAEILARRPDKAPGQLMTHLELPGGKRRRIKGRKGVLS